MKDVILENFNGENYLHVKEMHKDLEEGNAGLSLFVIYKSTVDFSDKYMVRLWQVAGEACKPIPTEYCIIKDTIGQCREAIPPNLFCFDRNTDDDPVVVVVETWF